MSLQLMQMLSTTIEAKDEYTKGHSHRVAEYSVLIARELGWNEKELSNLKNAAHLHQLRNGLLTFISDIMSTIRTQKTKETLDFLNCPNP